MQPNRRAADLAADVRIATEFDVPTLAATLAAAFQGYVWTDWVLPPATRGDRMVRCFDNDLRAVIKYWGQVWMTPDGTSAAAWIAPESPPMPEAEEKYYTDRFRDLLADRTDLVTSAESAVQKLRPAEHHWYLATMGTVPEVRRRGAGTAVLLPVLKQCDEAGVLAALDTSTQSNVVFYRRLGFEVTTELDPPGDAPHVWVMVRKPCREE